MDFDYSHPRTAVRFGRGRRDEVGEAAARHGTEALVVTTRSAMQDAGYLDDVTAALDDAGVGHGVYAGPRPNPTVEDVVAAVDAAPRADVVVGFGGGSALDVAKTTAVFLAEEEVPDPDDVWALATGDRGVDTAAPVVALPTTSGTGSHVDPWAVVSRDEATGKPGFGADAMVPEEAIVDHDPLDAMPADLAARTGFDAFCHLSEAYVATEATPMSDGFAREGLRLVSDHLEDAVAGDAAARERMAVADTLAGICESTSMVIATHALAHAVGAHHPEVAHGEALAAVAPSVAAHNVEHGGEHTKRRYGEIAAIFGEPVADRKLDAGLAVDAIEALREELGLPTSLDAVGVGADEVEALVATAREYTPLSIDANPVELSDDDLAAILEDAL
jgi:alcohol dehydrogenase class IV